MPPYEFVLILRALPKPELKAALKRAAEAVMSKGGILHKIENLGTRQLPVIMRKHQMNSRNGSYFILHFDSPTDHLEILDEECERDGDILKHNFCRVGIASKKVFCTLEDELLPPAYRPEVHKLLEQGPRKERKKFDMHLDYYPF